MAQIISREQRRCPGLRIGEDDKARNCNTHLLFSAVVKLEDDVIHLICPECNLVMIAPDIQHKEIDDAMVA